MSFESLLEIANVQNDVGPIVDAIAMDLDASRLHASTEQLNKHAAKIAIEHATAEEVVALVNSVLDTSSLNTSNLHVVESACGRCAVIIFNDDTEQSQVKELETAGVILEMSAEDDDDDDDDTDPDDLHIVESDTDIGDDDDEDEDDVPNGDPSKMKIANQDDVFKMLMRLHGIACGDDKATFPHFLLDADNLLNKHRNMSGFNPNSGQETASTLESEIYLELAKKAKGKKGYKEGRSGFLSSFMRVVSTRADAATDAWDALDSQGMIQFLSDVGADMLDLIEKERERRGIDAEDADQVDGQTAPETPVDTSEVVRV